MRYAVLSDVHGNRPALDSVVASLNEAEVDGVVCLGDIVGYGADPGYAIAVLRELASVIVTGNHDAAASSREHGFSFNARATEAIDWTRGVLAKPEKTYLRGLPFTAVHEGALLVHSSPRNPGTWPYVTTMRGARSAFSAFDEIVCFLGHTHEPAFFEWKDGKVTASPLPSLTMSDGSRYIVNAGSVGQPRDGDPRASYAVVDTDERRITIHRVEYDTERAGRDILAAGLPAFLAERLTRGD